MKCPYKCERGMRSVDSSRLEKIESCVVNWRGKDNEVPAKRFSFSINSTNGSGWNSRETIGERQVPHRSWQLTANRCCRYWRLSAHAKKGNRNWVLGMCGLGCACRCGWLKSGAASQDAFGRSAVRKTPARMERARIGFHMVTIPRRRFRGRWQS